MSYFAPGDVQISSIILNTNGGSVNLMYLMQSMSIYENILSPGVNAEVVVLEDNALVAVLPLLGEETLTVSFNTPSLSGPTYTFHVASIKNLNVTSNLKTRSYMIECVAQEVLPHKSTLIQKAYNTNISSMVQDIVSTFLKSSKTVNVEQTMGVQQYTVQNKKPFVAIKDLVKRSASSTNQSSTYTFFENQAGFNFKTIEGMMGQGPVAVFTNNSVTSDSIYRVIFRNILGYNVPELFNTPHKIGQGAFASITKTFDFKTMSFVNNLTQPASMKYGGSALNTAGFISQFAQSAGKSMHIQQDSTQPANFISNFLGNQKAYAANLDQQKMTMRIFGDSTLKAGDMITVYIMGSSGITGNQSYDPILSGNWMVSALRHVILTPEAKPQYTQLLELVSGGLGSASAASGVQNA